MNKKPIQQADLTVFVILIAMFLSLSCTKSLQKDTVVYENNFDSDMTDGIYNALISEYHGSKVLGRYSTGGFDLYVEELPEHDLIEVSFDLYIHDNWRGNSLTGINDSCDIWIMNFDGRNEKYTTFSNNQCKDDSCRFQAYPGTFPFPSNPSGANAARTDLPGVCSLKGVSGGTSKYRIKRTTYHQSKTFHLGCYAQLYAHRISADPLCAASWSIDNLTIKAIKFGE